MAGHDMIVIGASMGGVEALKRLAAQFPQDLPASVLVVQHTYPHSQPLLAEILNKVSSLGAVHPKDQEEILPGRIYVAPPDFHMLVRDGHILLSRGPKENRVRPAIDPLFRSAAISFGTRTVGVVLSGLQDDGTIGLIAIKRCGGVAIVQDPKDAAYPQMPLTALREDHPDHSLPLDGIGPLLDRLAREPVKSPWPIPEDLKMEVKLTEVVSGSISPEDMPGEPANLICPDCGGPLWELKSEEMTHYRCLTGHAFTRDGFMRLKNEEIERVLWEAVRNFEEKAKFLSRMAGERREKSTAKFSTDYARQVEQARENARILKEFMHSRLSTLPAEM
jgi:two-component system, chemotaxis family, protein-glutamate methylesterase/glutaminase